MIEKIIPSTMTKTDSWDSTAEMIYYQMSVSSAGEIIILLYDNSNLTFHLRCYSSLTNLNNGTIKWNRDDLLGNVQPVSWVFIDTNNAFFATYEGSSVSTLYKLNLNTGATVSTGAGTWSASNMGFMGADQNESYIFSVVAVGEGGGGSGLRSLDKATLTETLNPLIIDWDVPVGLNSVSDGFYIITWNSNTDELFLSKISTALALIDRVTLTNSFRTTLFPDFSTGSGDKCYFDGTDRIYVKSGNSLYKYDMTMTLIDSYDAGKPIRPAPVVFRVEAVPPVE